MKKQTSSKPVLLTNTAMATILAAVLIVAIMLNKSVPDILLNSLFLLIALIGFAISAVLFYYTARKTSQG